MESSNNYLTIFEKELIFTNFIQDNYDITHFNILGKGRIGTVISGRSIVDKIEHAIKIEFPEKEYFPEKVQELCSQYILRRNPHVVKIIDSFFDSIKNYLVISTEKAIDNFKNFIILNNFSKFYVLQMFSDIVNALSFSHKKKIFHHNIRPTNILVYETEDRNIIKNIQKLNLYSKKYIFKLTDWGSLNLKVENHRYYPTELINENLDSEYYMKKLDIYQLGFSLLEIIGVPIERLKKIDNFKNDAHNNDIENLLKEFQIETKFGKIFADIIIKMTKYSKEERCNLEDLKNYLIEENECNISKNGKE